MKRKITTWAAFLGLALVLISLLSRFVYPINFNVKTAMLIIGFTLMLLGTLWRVVTEMNEDNNND